MLFFCSIIFSAASHRLLATHASSQHLAVEDRGLSEAEEHQRILKELEEVHQLRERMLQQAATYGSSSTAPAPAPGSDSSDEYGLTPEPPSALVQHG
ncbi:MAG: hypothetical protein FRX49_10072 [Trebouxia sp. A1-2]|nr:MAG: hypothetical protein FRX49_10072 [Trebouxia sp. A1-2]